MQQLGASLGWKYNHSQGIKTRSDKITGWPSSLGTKPTKNEQDIIIQEYEDYLAANPELTIDDKITLIDDAQSLSEVKAVIKKILFNL